MVKYKDIEYELFSDGRVRSTFPNIGQMLFNNMEEFVAYVDGYHNTHEFIGMVETELRNAIEKHPKFCEGFTDDLTGMMWQEREEKVKARNAHHAPTAESVLMEEIAEAFNAYQHGDKQNALKEFAQCGAVIFRIMEMVQKGNA